MGHMTFSVDSYRNARVEYGLTMDRGITRASEVRAQQTGHLDEIVDPAINPMRMSKIRLNPHQKRWIVTVGCPMDIEVSCDTTGSMGGEVDTEMRVLPDIYSSAAEVLPGYDPQLCLGIFGDVCDNFVLCRPQFEMEAPKIVNYLGKMAPQRAGGDSPEDPQYAMFARAYLTDAYTNRIGLKGYHFTVTDATCHRRILKEDITRIFGENIFDDELKNMTELPDLSRVIKDLKKKTHQFVLVINSSHAAEFWRDLCGENSVIEIQSTSQLPEVISAIIGLTEGTLDITNIEQHLGQSATAKRVSQLSNIDIGAQATLRHEMEHPVPKKGDIFLNKEDVWPISQESDANDSDTTEATAVDADPINYL